MGCVQEEASALYFQAKPAQVNDLRSMRMNSSQLGEVLRYVVSQLRDLGSLSALVVFYGIGNAAPTEVLRPRILRPARSRP